jgi:hypothetical protein
MSKTIKEWFEWAKEQVHKDGSRLYPWAEEALQLCKWPHEEHDSLNNALLGAFLFSDDLDRNWYGIYNSLEYETYEI